MLKWIELEGVGPAPRLRIDLAERLSVLTGDNGLGKTFLLDVAWWALTYHWPNWPGLARPDSEHPQIHYQWGHHDAPAKWVLDLTNKSWALQEAIPLDQGVSVAIYVRVDGGFSVFDGLRTVGRGRPAERLVADHSLHFSTAQVWNGLEVDGRRRCEGLIRDWVSWQRGKMPEFEQLRTVLRTLSTEEEPLTPAEPQRVSLDDGFDTPCIATRYGVVPLTHASAAVRRIVGLSYLLVWAWREHCIAAKLLRRQPVRKILLLVDEPETHLHPKWQRLILPALLAAVKKLLASESVDIQILTATHSPLVLASLEPHFDVQVDKLLHLGLKESAAYVEEVAWAKQGDVVNWLVSESFGLQQGRSLQAEQAIEAAEAFLRGEPVSSALSTRAAIHERLVSALASHDDFWPRWLVESGAIT